MMKHAILGSTDIEVSRIGLGTVKFGRNQKINYPESFDLPTDKAILNLLASAQDFGINLLDTAPAYGTSEERLGQLLQGQRQQWVLATKVGEEFTDGESAYNFTYPHVIHSIERSLQRLQTDYLDIVLIHSNGEDEKIIADGEALQALQELKKMGKIRAFGMSTKTVAGGKLAVDLTDIVMVTHNPIHTEEQAVIDYAEAKHKGIFIKKALASGHLNKISSKDPVSTAMEFIFKHNGVTSIILGTLNPEHLKHNVDCAMSAIG